MATLSVDLKEHPESYTYWFRISFDRFLRAVAPMQLKYYSRHRQSYSLTCLIRSGVETDSN